MNDILRKGIDFTFAINEKMTMKPTKFGVRIDEDGWLYIKHNVDFDIIPDADVEIFMILLNEYFNLENFYNYSLIYEETKIDVEQTFNKDQKNEKELGQGNSAYTTSNGKLLIAA